MGKSEFYAKRYYAGLALEPRFAKILKIAGRMKAERLLDIGCGDGSFTVLLKEKLQATEVHGPEIAPKAVLAADKKGINAYLIDIDKRDLPYDDNYFDFIYCGEIIEHLFNPDHLLMEVYRVLKPGGTCIITTPNLASWANRLALILGYQPFATAVSLEQEGTGKLIIKGEEGQRGHIRVFTVKALKDFLRNYKFKINCMLGCPVLGKSSSLKLLFNLIKVTDNIMSCFPSLAYKIIY